MNEAQLKAALVKHLRKVMTDYTILRHEDRINIGVPDITMTGDGHTTWLEAKYAKPGFTSRESQEFAMKRLAAHGRCWYLIYETRDGRDRTGFIRPADLNMYRERVAAVGLWTNGFDHDWVGRVVRTLHRATRS